MYHNRDPLHARCERLRDAAIANACEPALEESGLHGLFRLWDITAGDEPMPLPILQRLLRPWGEPWPELLPCPCTREG